MRPWRQWPGARSWAPACSEPQIRQLRYRVVVPSSNLQLNRGPLRFSITGSNTPDESPPGGPARQSTRPQVTTAVRPARRWLPWLETRQAVPYRGGRAATGGRLGSKTGNKRVAITGHDQRHGATEAAGRTTSSHIQRLV